MNIFRGEVFYFTASPIDKTDAYCFYEDGGLVIFDGKIVDVGEFQLIQSKYKNATVVDYSGKLITPGFIDSHIHFPQTEIIGMYGKQLLDWLNNYTFPAEQAFQDPEHAQFIAHCFLNEVLKSGTTTCVAYSTVHPISVTSLFSVASEYNMRIITGKVLMNQNAPGKLCDTTTQGEKDTHELIQTWHGKGRNQYVITPRFAITSTFDQLVSVSRLHKEYPDTYIQTHLSENKNEIEATMSIHKGYSDYLDVYEKAGIITDRTILGHSIHLSESEKKRIASAGAIIAHCPTSNLFLGSGLFDMKSINSYNIQTTLATDVGAGTSFSLLKTMGEAYKIQQLQGYSMSPFESWYKCTLGAAKALKIDNKIGSLIPGNEADFIVLDYAKTFSQSLRMEYLQKHNNWTLENRLFGLQILGDERNVESIYLMGNLIQVK